MEPLNGIHHITLITGDAAANVDFYARVLGLRLVKKTVNQDDPTVYHLFYADENGSPGADLTFFEYPGAPPGRAGAGMVSSIIHRVGSEWALDFWAARLAGEMISVERSASALAFADPEGMRHELAVVDTGDEPLIALANEIPRDHALQGFEGVRGLVANLAESEAMLRDGLGLTEVGSHEWEARGASRGGRIHLRESAERGVQGAGTVHHLAWAALGAEMEAWRREVMDAGGRPTPVIDRFYFESVYFREPSGILVELATLDGKGMASDEPAEHLGQRLSLPPNFESVRERVEQTLATLPDTQQWRPAPAHTAG